MNSMSCLCQCEPLASEVFPGKVRMKSTFRLPHIVDFKKNSDLKLDRTIAGNLERPLIGPASPANLEAEICLRDVNILLWLRLGAGSLRKRHPFNYRVQVRAMLRRLFRFSAFHFCPTILSGKGYMSRLGAIGTEAREAETLFATVAGWVCIERCWPRERAVSAILEDCRDFQLFIAP